MMDAIPVFVNERRIMIPRGGTAAMAAAQLDPAWTAGPEAGALTFTDARGLPVLPDAVLATGAILRVAASARRLGAADADA